MRNQTADHSDTRADTSGHGVNLLEFRYRQLRKQYEHQLRIINAIGASSPDFTYIFNRDHRFIYVSPPLLKLWGRTLDEAVGKNYEDLGYAPDVVTLHRAQLNEVLNGKTVSGANSFINHVGNICYYEYTFVPVFGEDGQVETIVGTTQDTTYKRKAEQERKKYLEQLLENETQFRYFADSMPHLAWIASADSRISWFNRRWFEYTGTFPEDVEGLGALSVCDPTAHPEIKQSWKVAIAHKQPFEIEYKIRGKDGEFRWFLTRGTPVFNSKGELIKWFGTNTNIDDQRRANEFNKKLQKFTAALSQSHTFCEVACFIAEQSRELFGATRIILAEVDHGSNKLKLNSTSGFSEETVDGLGNYLSLDESFPMQECARVGVPIFCNCVDDMVARWPAMAFVLNNTKSKCFSFLPLLYDGKIRAVVGAGYAEPKIFRDDEKYFLESVARQSSQALERARIYDELQNAICSRDSFMGIASHELKTPLTSLKLQAQMIRKSFVNNPAGVLPEKIQRFVGIVNEQVGRLTTLVDDMLDISRIVTGKLAIHKEPADLSTVIHDVTDRFATQFELVGCQLNLSLCEPTSVNVDVYRIEQVINNLITNAIKYAPGSPIAISVARKENKIQLIVADEGPGIPSENHQRIFERFERFVSANEVSGLGIGLFISKQIVEAHEGKIWVESLLGRGTRFYVELPTLQTNI